MRRLLREQMRIALPAFLFLTALTGLAYPVLVAELGQGFFFLQSHGSLVRQDGRTIGAAPIGQAFRSPRYFQGRPSATAPAPYNAAASTGSNLASGNPGLAAVVAVRLAALRAANPEATGAVPAELLLASASGLDPHVSPAAAAWQIPRVARARGLDEAVLRELLAKRTEGRTWGILGEPRVNVLLLNLALDVLDRSRP